jgi:glycosyltransferase involved in cell wall biosynthesis
MNTKYQSEILYQHFDKNKTYHFVSGFHDIELKYELSEFRNFMHAFLPLSIDVKDADIQWVYTDSPVKKIGIFTRLSSHKPLDPFIYAFHLLLEKFPDAELHVFGSGDPEKEGMAAYVRHLHLNDKVKFRGHAENLKETALNEKLSLVWFHAYHGIPGGFAGFDICTTGIPQLFWNFGTASESDMQHVFPMHHNLLSFVAKNTEILSDQKMAVTLSELQFHYIVNERNIQKHIGTLEELYFNIAKNKENL